MLYWQQKAMPTALRTIFLSPIPLNLRHNLSAHHCDRKRRLALKTQRARFPENAKRYNEPIIKIF